MSDLRMPGLARIALADTRYEVLSLMRQPGYALPTLLFPVMFYVFFGLVFRMGEGVHMPTYLIASYGTFGVMAPALFGFGVGVALERSQGWLRLKQASPAPPLAYFLAKTGMALLFAAIVVLLLMSLGAIFGDVRLSRLRWFWTFGVLVGGTIPFCAIGLLIGTLVRGQAAPAVVNLIYLPISLLSGLWLPIEMFPQSMRGFATILPPYHLAQLAFRAVGMPTRTESWVSVAYLSVIAVVCVGLAVVFFYRNED